MKQKRLLICTLIFFLALVNVFAQHSRPPFVTLYVDANSAVPRSDGSGEAPFTSIADVLKAIDVSQSLKNSQCCIVLLSDIYDSKALIIDSSIILKGASKRTRIHFGKNAGFIVSNAALRIENCEISRAERIKEPRDVPLLYAANSIVHLNNSSIEGKEAYSLIRIYDSSLAIENSFISMQAAYSIDYCTFVRSQVNFKNVACYVRAQVIDAFILEDAVMYIYDSSIFLHAEQRAQGFRLSVSKISARSLSLFCSHRNRFGTFFAPFAVDIQSELFIDAESTINGFSPYYAAPILPALWKN